MIDPAIQKIIGKTIESVVVSEKNRGAPPTQIFLVFTDGTSYEFYGDVHVGGGLDSGGAARALRYVAGFHGQITHYIGDDE